jgi:hypothetical protein
MAESINVDRNTHNLAVQIAGLPTISTDKDLEEFKEELRKAIREGVKETSKLFSEAAVAIKKAKDGL